ncbi:hypothetical protein M9Y10_010734 [Tritrichomonas musculus]|uniref:BTB domain-containing protein n=1 Tax=Tritrichomonas musculus TaxID=1915356 RepID=A0ABR2ILI5_9EUKA
MSIYLKRKEDNILKAAKQFITINPTTDEVSKFFQCQKSIDHDFDLSKFSIYFNNVNKYLQSSENSYISYFSVNYIIKEKVSIDLDSAISIIKSLLFELKTVDIESDKYGQIETTINSFISKYPSYELLQTLLSCPYFDISKVDKFKEILSNSPSQVNFTDSGYFSTHESDSKEYNVDSNSIVNEGPNRFLIEDKLKPSFTINFHSFSFDIESYSFNCLDRNKYPVSWSLLASSDMKNYIEIHNCNKSGISENVRSIKLSLL